jgi:uncharacterized protein YkwD
MQMLSTMMHLIKKSYFQSMPLFYQMYVVTYIRKCLPVMIIVYLLSACKKEETTTDFSREKLKTEMLNAVNLLRSTGCYCGTDAMPPVKPLTWNDTLAVAAEAHVMDMYLHQYFSHISLDGSAPIQRAMKAGYKGNYIGENIAKEYYTITAVMAAWQQSEAHCKAMMDTLYTEMGAAVTHGYWAQEFGRYK